MQKSKLTPDPIRDAPEGHGNGQSPSAIATLPGRATRDTRFVRFPMTFFVFAYCCSHASGYTALFWVNQSTIARDMEISQQAVSQHMRKLMEWGYIEKLRNQDVRRKYGKKGALWRVCFDPTMSYDEVKAVADAMPKTEEEEQAIAQETIEEAAKGAKGQQTRAKRQDKPVDNSASHKPQLVEENDKYKPQLVRENKVQLVNNSTTRTIDKDINEVDCRRLCIAYTHAVNSRWGRGFRHDLRQEQLARQLLELGYTHETFISDAESLLDWMLKKNKQPPSSLQYFISRKEKQDKPKDAQDMVKHLASKMRMP